MKHQTAMAPTSGQDGMGAPRPSLRDKFRGEGLERHARLDQMFEGLQSERTPSLYHGFIQMTQACHTAIEPILEAGPLPAALPGWTERRQSAALDADLSEMKLEPLVCLPFPLPHPDLAQSLGILYVLEGSRLGARYMLKAMRGRTAEPEWDRTSFHYLETADEPDRFRGFMLQASELMPDDAARDRAVAAANMTFDYFLETERNRILRSKAKKMSCAEGFAA